MTKVIIFVEHYDYFGGHKFSHQEYSSLLEGFAAYKYAKEHHDYDYDDSFHETRIRLVRKFPVQIPEQRPHARSKWEWERMCKEVEESKNKTWFEEFLNEAFIDDEVFFDIDDEDDILI